MKSNGTSVESIKAKLRLHSLHATASRIAVLQALLEEHTHVTAEDVRARVLRRYPAIDPATVYRTLETLERASLVVRVELGDKVTRWANLGDSHHHLVCRQCSAVVELDDGPFQVLADRIDREYGLRVDMQHIVLRGLCRSCATAGTQEA